MNTSYYSRRRNSNSSSNSNASTSSIDSELLQFCGACSLPLHEPPPIDIINASNEFPNESFYLNYDTVTCANYKKHSTKCYSIIANTENKNKSRQAHTRSVGKKRKRKTSSLFNHLSRKRNATTSSNRQCQTTTILLSPHFHFCCSGVPRNSLLYNKLASELSNTRSTSNGVGQLANGDIIKDNKDNTTGSTKIIEAHEHSNAYANVNNAETAKEQQIQQLLLPNIKIKEATADFFCPACDVKGTSMYLYEYFSTFHEYKQHFYNDLESISCVQPVGYVDDENTSNSDNNYEGMATDNGFVKFLLDVQSQKMQLQTTSASTATSTSAISPTERNSHVAPKKKFQQRRDQQEETCQYKHTELRLDHIQNIIYQIPSSSVSSSFNSVHTRSRKINYNNSDKNNEKNHNSKTKLTSTTTNTKTPIDAKWLVGKPLRLYCSVSDSYYTGRIIASKIIRKEDLSRLQKQTKDSFELKMKRQANTNLSILSSQVKNHHKNSPSNIYHETANILLDRDIGRTMYLVRFRAGVEGRKIALHQWIFLEEHAIMVGISIVWVNMDLLIKNYQYHDSHYDTHSLHSTNNHDNCNNNNDCNNNGLTLTSKSQRDTNQHHQIKKKFKFQPMQIFVRTALEMAFVDEINNFNQYDRYKNKDLSSLLFTAHPVNVFCALFSRNFQGIILQVGQYNVDDDKEVDNSKSHSSSPSTLVDQNGIFCKISKTMGGFLSSTKQKMSLSPEVGEKKEYESSLLQQDNISLESSNQMNSMSNLLIVDFHHPPKEFQLQLEEALAIDEHVNIPVSLAIMEAEEQCRIKNSITTL